MNPPAALVSLGMGLWSSPERHLLIGLGQGEPEDLLYRREFYETISWVRGLGVNYFKSSLTAEDLPPLASVSVVSFNDRGGRIYFRSEDLPPTGVTAGSYTLASVTVDAYGRVTSASTGSVTFETDGITLNQSTIGDPVLTVTSTAANDDPTMEVVQAKVTTTDATLTTLATIALADDTAYLIVASVVGRRTGGTSGTAGHSCFARMMSGYRRTSGGGATVIGSFPTDSVTAADAIGVAASLATSGNNVLVQVQGIADNNYSWTATVEYHKLSS